MRGLSLVTFLSHVAFALLCSFLFWALVCPDFRSSAVDRGHPYKILLVCASLSKSIEVQSEAATIISELKTKRIASVNSFPRRVDCISQSTILPSSSLSSSSLQGRLPSSASTIKRTHARSCSSWHLGEKLELKTHFDRLSQPFNSILLGAHQLSVNTIPCAAYLTRAFW